MLANRGLSGMRLRPLLRPEGEGLGSPAPQTVQQVEEAATDVTAALERMAKAFESVAPHLEKLVSEGLKLHPVEAVKQVPEAGTEVLEGTGQAAGDVAAGAGHAVAAAPAAVTDAASVTQSAGTGAKRAFYTVRKR